MIAPVDAWLKKVFPNSPHKRITVRFFFNYTALLVLVAFYCVCFWLWVGDKYLLNDMHDPWQIANSDFENYDNYQLFIFAQYWIATVIFTVGYGDYTGGTQVEIIITIVFEFAGILMMSIIMYIITMIVDGDHGFQAYYDNKVSKLELWINAIEKCNIPKHINPLLLH